MKTAIVSPQGQVLIPAEIRIKLGIHPGSRLDFTVEGNTIRIELGRSIKPSSSEEGYGMLVCDKPGKRHLSEFDVAQAMRDPDDDRA